METKEELLKKYNTAMEELKEWEAEAEKNPNKFNLDKCEEFQIMVNGLKYEIKNYGKKSTEKTRVRINYKISAKNLFQPDITCEAETTETAMALLDETKKKLDIWAKEQGFIL